MTTLATRPLGASADRVLLICMPMGLVQTPNLGLSLLKAAIERSGIACDVRYLSVEMLEQFIPGSDAVPRYVRLVDQPHLSEVCASFFAADRFGPDPERDRLVARHLETVTPNERDLIADIANAVTPFLSYCLDAVPWHNYSIAGFTTLFAGMTVPSAALAARLKARVPHLQTMLGGWNTGGDMGEVIAERMPEFDYVLRGESEDTFPELVRRILSNQPVDGIPGLVVRDQATGKARAWPQQLVRDMDALPIPDFSDYFSTMARGRFQGDPPGGWSIPFESSRGCWWGAKRHCKFCGLNGLSMPYRSKSPARLVDEVDQIVARHHPRLLFAADTILDLKYFDTVVPMLTARYPGVNVAYEVKAPVRREQMARLAGASLNLLTVGVESLSTRVLRLMDKGTTYLKNVQCLRLAEEYNVQIGWQYLFGIPGERLEDYVERASDMRLLHHLPPPLQSCPVTLARFSPYFFDAATNGVTHVRAHPDYRMTYSWPEEDLNRVAYHFEFDFGDGRAPELTATIAALMTAVVEQWRAARPSARLDLRTCKSGGWIVDTRWDEPKVYVLDPNVCRVILALDADRTAASLANAIAADARANMLDSLLASSASAGQAVWREALEEAERLGVSPMQVVVPPAPLLGGADDLHKWVAAVVADLQALGMVVGEDDRWISLAVPRGQVAGAFPGIQS
jgi:ribosomal peptide maturation radical SAM protein 1